jgi:DNA-binding NarL/FixJ family response regulator
MTKVTKSEITIGLAEDHQILRDSLIPLLESDTNIKVLFGVSNGKELLDKLTKMQPDIILLDIDMPIVSGREALRIIRKDHPKIKVIVLSSHYVKTIIVDFIKLGVSAFLPKTGQKEKLIEVIRTVYSEGVCFDKEVSAMMAKELAKAHDKIQEPENEITFSDIELSIIKLICQNKVSKEIADLLNLSPRTVEWHRSNIMKRSNSKKVSDLLIFALKNNLVNVI